MPRAKSFLKRLSQALHIEPFSAARPVIIAALCVGASVLLVIGFARTQMTVRAAVASADSVLVGGPLSINLSQDVAPSFSAKLEPSQAGRWETRRSLFGASSLVFTPQGHFQADRTYIVRLTGLKRAFTGAAIPGLTQSFTTQAPSKLQSVSIKPGAKDIPALTKFVVTLSGPNRGIRYLRASLSPAVPLNLTSSGDTIFTWTPSVALSQGTTYEFHLDDARLNGAAARLATVPFTVVAAPGVTSARTGPYFTPGQNVDITFDQAMEPGSAEFSFDTPGKSGWLDDHTFRFTPSSLHPGETHTYTIKKGLKSKAGGIMEVDRSFQFETNGPVGGWVSPGGGGIGLDAAIAIHFDQAVDHGSAQAHFSLNPGVAGSFSWSGNTMTYKPSGLAYQTGYSYSEAPGVTPAWGLPSAVTLAGSFSTILQTVQLNVPFFKQPYHMSCELTALRMVLAHYGISTDELTIVNRVGYAPRPRDTSTNTWDNPNVMFVGDINGAMDSTGYGVYSGPIAKAAQTFGHSASAFTNVSPQWVAQQIYQGHPVIIWGHSTPAWEDDWNTPQGPVRAYISAHARVVYGVTGSIDNPSSFYLNDPMGSRLTWTPGQLSDTMNVIPGVSNQAVVVY
jgi:uncharacterized protein YvpB